jgi:single-strand DNA-binding protein
MTRGLNKVMIIGRLGRDPEMRYTPNGRPVTAFSVAVNRTWTTGDGDRREDTEWFNVVAWGTLAEICKQHLRKGQSVYVEGRLQTRGWEDPEGKKHYRTEIVANEMIMLGDKREGGEDLLGAAASAEEEEFPF